MTRKRKFDDCSSEIECIGPEYLCPYCIRSVRRKLPRRVRFGAALYTDESGFLIYKIGDIIFERYEVLSELGRGGYGLVLKVNDKQLEETVVLKIVKNNEACHHDAVKEFFMLKLAKRLDPNNEHRYVQLIDAFCTGGHICLIFEFLGPDLLTFMMQYRSSTMTLFEINAIGRQLCDAIGFLHENDIIHNDIKPGNIALVDTTLHSKDADELEIPLSNMEIRVIDFGSVKTRSDIRAVATTSPYRAPENLLEIQSSQAYDIWSIGCTLFELYTGETLFETDEELRHLAMIEYLLGRFPAHMTAHSRWCRNGKFKLDKRTKVARDLGKNLKKLDEYKRSIDAVKENEFFELLKQMLTIDPGARISAKEALKHKFFSENSSEENLELLYISKENENKNENEKDNENENEKERENENENEKKNENQKEKENKKENENENENENEKEEETTKQTKK